MLFLQEGCKRHPHGQKEYTPTKAEAIGSLMESRPLGMQIEKEYNSRVQGKKAGTKDPGNFKRKKDRKEELEERN